VVLAGGQARRMNGADKPLLILAGRTLMAHVIERAAPQVDELLINANGDLSRFDRFGRTLVSDPVGGYPGPLAGVLAAFEWTRQNRPDARWLVSFACDCPFLPRDLVSRLTTVAQNSGVQIAAAVSGNRHHPVFTAWSTDLPLNARDILLARGLRKVDDLVGAFPNIYVEFSDNPIDPFFNINTPDDLTHAEALADVGVRTNA
jgi:molybdopterin-guanine dinucleotide biosynthesis protein A